METKYNSQTKQIFLEKTMGIKGVIRKFRKLKIKSPFLVISLVSCILLVSLAYTLFRMEAETSIAEELNDHTNEVIKTAQGTLKTILDLETGKRGYLLTGSSEFIQPYEAAKKELEYIFSQLEPLIQDNQTQLKLLTSIKKDARLWIKISDDHLKQTVKVRSDGLTKKLTQAKTLMDNIRTSMSEFINNELELLKIRKQLAEKKQKRYYFTLVFGIFGVLTGLLISNFIVSSITSRSKQIQTQLEESKHDYALILRGIKDGVFDLNVKTKKITFSNAYESLLGYSKDEMPSDVAGGLTLTHEDDKEVAAKNLSDFLEGKIKDFSHEVRLRHKEGHYIWILSRGVPVYENGKIVRILGTHTDITEQRKREEQLKQLNTDLESFIYIVSHDLRTPLVNMRGFASEIEYSFYEMKEAIDNAKENATHEDKMKIEQGFDKDIPEALQFIKMGVERMDSLTSSILELSRIGKNGFIQTEVDVNSIIKRILEGMAYDINNKNVKISYNNLPNVNSDKTAIEQVFGNILDNAVKYLDESRPGEIKISSEVKESNIIFIVEDNGRGISQEDYKKVFDIFRRAGNSGDVRGNGMGMAFVKTMLMKLGGKIWFESKLNEGTKFFISIPNKI